MSKDKDKKFKLHDDVKEFAKALDKTVSQNWNADDVKATAFRYMRENIIPKYIKVLEDV